MVTTLLTLMLCYPLCRVTAEEAKNAVERHSGAVARQLLEYEWQAIEGAQALPTNVLKSYRFSANDVFSKAFAPPRDATISVHYRTEDTCDALKLSYQQSGLQITVVQTRSTKLVVVRGPSAVVANSNNALTVASGLAKQVLAWPETFPLVATETSERLCVGRPTYVREGGDVYRLRKFSFAPKEGFLMHHWWSDGEEIAFFGIKVPHTGKTGISPLQVDNSDMASFDHNRRWF